MPFNPIDDRQVIQKSALSTSIGSSANTTLSDLFAHIDSVMVNLNGTQTLTNKTINGNDNTLTVLANTQLSGVTPTVNGGTGLSSPGTAGNVLTSDGTTWISAAGGSSSAPIGTVLTSMLTTTQFQSQVGLGWVLGMGQAVPGSTYETVTGGSSVTSSAASSVNTTGATIIFSTQVLSTTANTNSNNQLTNIASVTGLAVGELVSGTGISAGTTVSSIDQYTFALSGTPNQYTYAVHSSNQYIFTVSSANATVGAVYGNNSQTFTVNATIVGSTTLLAVGTGDPLPSGTLTLMTGTGDATITFTSFAYAGANATAGAIYTNNTHSFTVSSTISGGTSLVAIGTGDPLPSGILTKSSGTGDTTITFTSFTFGAHNATAGATYTNNGHTFTVSTSIDDGVTLVTTGTGIPTNSGTLTLSSGVGDATIPFTSVKTNITMSQNAASSGSITVLFSNFVTSTTGNLAISSASITGLASSVGIANGQIISVAGISPYATVSAVTVTTVPDFRATVLRGKDNGRGLDPNGDLPLGTYEPDAFESHTHTILGLNSLSLSAGGQTTYFAGSSQTAAAGGNETRGKSTVVNIFIRIN